MCNDAVCCYLMPAFPENSMRAKVSLILSYIIALSMMPGKMIIIMRRRTKETNSLHVLHIYNRPIMV